MSPPQVYQPISEFPDFDGSSGAGPLKFENSGDVLNWYIHWRMDSEIATVSNTTPIVITTSAAHEFQTGYKVIIKDSTITAADGTWTVTRVSSTSFSLDTSTAGGASAGAGIAVSADLGLLAKLVDACAFLGKAASIRREPAFYWDGSYTNDDKPTINAGADAALKLYPPDAARVRTFKVKLSPAVHANLPASMPQLFFFKVALNGVLDTMWSVTDTSANVGIYNAAHDLTLDLGADETIDRENFLYRIQFVQETGANSANGAIGPVRVRFF